MTTYSELANYDQNMLVQAYWPQQRNEFIDYLECQASSVQQIVTHHLALPPHQACEIAPKAQWKCGSFNVCIPVKILQHPQKRVMVRCPLPHRFKSPTSPDTASEKLRSEAATFAWLSEYCPDVPIPRLWGFGLSNGRSFIPLAQASWLRRAYECVRRHVSKVIYGIDDWRPFVPSPSLGRLKTGYIVMDFIEPSQGKMLGATDWPSHDPLHRRNLFGDLARILLSMIRVPLPRIGSFTVGDLGEVTLTGRPLTAPLVLLEAEGIPTDIPPNTTYSSAESYIDDLLHCHTTRLEHQPNAVESKLDAEGQVAAVVVLRAVRSSFTDRSLREGPFFLQFTDLHECNIFVNDQFNITAIVDLEWYCSLPLGMQGLPFWFTGNTGDDFLNDDTEIENAYEMACKEFLDILAHEQSTSTGLLLDPARVLRAALERKSHWYFAAISNPRVAYSFLGCHMHPLFAPLHNSKQAKVFQEVFAPYYSRNVPELVKRKIADKAEYDKLLRAAFEG